MVNSDYIIREYRENDTEALSGIWQSVFGDDPEYIHAFFSLLPRTGTGAVAEKDGKPAAMAFAMTGINYGDKSCAYIYAVATLPEHRGQGLGEAVSRAAAEYSGADIICTMPAEDGLYRWYNEILGLDDSLFIEEIALTPNASCKLTPISAEEYHVLRENQLSPLPHVSFSSAHIELLEALCLCYGGGLYRCGDTVLAAQSDGQTCRVVEALGSQTEAASAALGAQLNVQKILLRRPALTGSRFVAFKSGTVQSGTYWGPVFD